MGYKIYVDGSCIGEKVGYGAAVLRDAELIRQMKGYVPAADAAGTRQVAGELVAVGRALRWCEQQNIREVEIYYDYKGIECWATGEWKAKQPLTQRYAKFARQCPVVVRWRKVKAHSGNRWNDLVDELAKQGAASAPEEEAITNTEAARQSSGELETKALAFVERLNEDHVPAQFDKVYNGQFARIVILKGGAKAGYFDLYHTAKKPFSPYVHAFKDARLKAETERAWRAFHKA